MNKWQDPNLTLGERCVAFAENEMKNKVAEDRPGSFTSPRIREYFSICTRLQNGKEVSLSSFKAGNWCSAFGCFCLHESLLPGESLPHGYRLGVVEVVADMTARGLYHKISDIRSSKYEIKKGDIIVFDRSKPNDSSTNWYRHFGRVYEVLDKENFKCISGNNGGTIKITNHKLSQVSLLGFGEYPISNRSLVVPVEEFNVKNTELAPMKDLSIDTDLIFNILKKF